MPLEATTQMRAVSASLKPPEIAEAVDIDGAFELRVSGIVVATEGDVRTSERCFHRLLGFTLPAHPLWTDAEIKRAARDINEDMAARLKEARGEA